MEPKGPLSWRRILGKGLKKKLKKNLGKELGKIREEKLEKGLR